MSFQQVEEKQIIEPKNIIVFIYTDWCKYCKLMENTTFRNKEIIEKLNQESYFIRLNAEEKNDILFAGKTFHYKPTGTNTGVHELAEELGTIRGKLSYPTLVILNSNNEIIFQYNGYLKTSEFFKFINEK
jgi:thioredoxin-related protein